MPMHPYDRLVDILRKFPARTRSASRDLSVQLRSVETASSGEPRAAETGQREEPAQEPLLFEIKKAVPDAWLPEGMALVKIIFQHEDGQPLDINAQKFKVSAVCCPNCGRFNDPKIYGKPEDLDLDYLTFEDALTPRQTLSHMRRWSVGYARLARWLDDCRDYHDPPDLRDRKPLQLVIWDDLRYRMPWELLWIEGKSNTIRPSSWLGAEASVTRWGTLEVQQPEYVKDFRKAYVCRGNAAAYVHAPMPDEDTLRSAFPRLMTTPSVTKLAQLLASAVSATTEALAMVYVACHGRRSGSALEPASLADFSLEDAAEYMFERLRDPAETFVFLNACYSGDLTENAVGFNDGVHPSFAREFLRRGAVGVLATTGRVGEDVALQTVKDLLKFIGKHPNTPVPEVLRQLRQDIWKAVEAELHRAAESTVPPGGPIAEPTVTKVQFSLLYRFMYVYYGSPRTVLALPEGN